MGPLTVSPQEFFWSWSRWQTWQFCQRAYFYRYYAANTGLKPHTDAEFIRLFQLKNILKTDVWIQGVFSDSIRQIFLEKTNPYSHKSVKSDLLCKMLRKINNGYYQQTSRKQVKDPKALNLYEITCLGYPVDDWFENCRLRITEALENFSGSNLLNEVCSVPYLNRKQLKPVCSFYFEGIKIWTSTALTWTKEDKCDILTFDFSNRNVNQTFPASNLINALMTVNNSRFPPDNIRIRVFMPMQQKNNLQQLPVRDNLDELTRLIRETSLEMQTKTSRSNTISEEDFPRREECLHTHPCQSCVFHDYCRNSIN